MSNLNYLSTDHLIDELHRRLMSASIASCECMTKTPDPAHHRTSCRYNRLSRAADSLDTVQALVEGYLI